MNRVGIAIFILILLQPLIANAQLSAICSTLFGYSSTIATPSTYTDLLNFSLLIILLVITVISIVYAIGYSLGISTLIAYSRTELLESIFNVILIFAVVGGMGIFYGLTAFITNVESTITNTPTTFTSAQEIYTNLCTNYFNSVSGLFDFFVNLYITNLISTLLLKFKVNLMPNYGGLVMLTPGVTLNPLGGMGPWAIALSNIFKVATALVGIDIGIPLLLFFIYSVFPFFLYAGVLFRSFPWTRAAGGTMLALFISFYVVFPALLYPLSEVPTQSVAVIQSKGLQFNANSWYFIAEIPNFLKLGNFIEVLVGVISGIALQVGGFVVALIISYDMVEIFGKLLGAPSASGTSILSKVI